MDEGQLLTLIKNYEQASLGSQVAAGATISTTVYPSNQAMTTLQVDRYNALNAFWARPLGNEVENRSQVVLPVVRDTMAWIMPQLMRMFAASKSICRFDPENEQDEEQAETETEVVNQVFMAQNVGPHGAARFLLGRAAAAQRLRAGVHPRVEVGTRRKVHRAGYHRADLRSSRTRRTRI